MHYVLFLKKKKTLFMQNELQVSIQQKKLGEPITDTLFGKTVSVSIIFGKQ